MQITEPFKNVPFKPSHDSRPFAINLLTFGMFETDFQEFTQSFIAIVPVFCMCCVHPVQKKMPAKKNPQTIKQINKNQSNDLLLITNVMSL